MDCDVITDLMPAYESEAASARTRQLVEEHLATCQTCRAAFGNGSPSEEVGTLPTPTEPDERDVLLRIREELLTLWSDAQPPDERPVLARLREAFLNLLAGAPLFLINAVLMFLIYSVFHVWYWSPFSPREARLGFPLSAVPAVLEMLLFLCILAALRWIGCRYVYGRTPPSSAALYLGIAWLALLGLGLLSFFITGTLTAVVAPCLAMALSLTYVRRTPRLALVSIGLLTLVNLSLAIYVLSRVYLAILQTYVWG